MRPAWAPDWARLQATTVSLPSASWHRWSTASLRDEGGRRPPRGRKAASATVTGQRSRSLHSGLNAGGVMYLRFDSRRGPANDVKLAAMTDRSFSTRRRRLAVVGLVLLAAAATVAARAADVSLIGHTAPDFALPAVVGSNVRLSEYRGQAVIISFWSSRCSVCARQLALLDRLYSTYRSAGLVVLAVSVDDEPLRAEQYARAHVGGFPLLLDSAKTVSRAYDIDRLPSTVMIDRSGIVRYWHGDDRADDDSYVKQIRALLDDSVASP